MSFEPYGITIFCDDIRNEVGGKLTLVGCYSSDMIIQTQVAVILPTLCALISVRLPLPLSFKNFEIALIKEISGISTEMFRAQIDPPEVSALDSGSDVLLPQERQTSVVIQAKLSPFTVEGPGLLRSRAYLDGKEVRMGSLQIKFSEEAATSG